MHLHSKASVIQGKCQFYFSAGIEKTKQAPPALPQENKSYSETFPAEVVEAQKVWQIIQIYVRRKWWGGYGEVGVGCWGGHTPHRGAGALQTRDKVTAESRD